MDLQEKALKLDYLYVSLVGRFLSDFTSESTELTLKEMLAVEILGRRGTLTMSEFAATLAVPLTTMTSLVTRMVRKGWFERRRVEEDRRVVLVTLSPQGQALFDQHLRDHVESMAGLLSVLTEEEQEQLITLFAKVLAAVGKGGAGR